jgi:hypothetical protein
MADIARMRFQSAKRPDETGIIKITDEGTIQVEPSEQMLETIARMEQDAVEVTGRNSIVVAGVLIGVGLMIAAIGWAAGRHGGRLRERIGDARLIEDAKLSYDAKHGVEIRFDDDILSRASLSWAPGEYNADEAEKLFDTYKSLGGK